MESHRIAGVVVELGIALGIVGAGVLALTGVTRPRRVWALLWGEVPGRRDAAAIVLLGIGVGLWALSQAQDRAMGQAVVGIVVVGVAGLALAVAQLRRSPDEG